MVNRFMLSICILGLILPGFVWATDAFRSYELPSQQFYKVRPETLRQAPNQQVYSAEELPRATPRSMPSVDPSDQVYEDFRCKARILTQDQRDLLSAVYRQKLQGYVAEGNWAEASHYSRLLDILKNPEPRK